MPRIDLKNVTREQFIDALVVLVWSIVADTKGERGWKTRAKDENRAVDIICAKAGVTLTEADRMRILE